MITSARQGLRNIAGFRNSVEHGTDMLIESWEHHHAKQSQTSLTALHVWTVRPIWSNQIAITSQQREESAQ